MNTRLIAALIGGSLMLAGCGGGGGGGTSGMTDAGGSPLPYTGLSGGQIVAPGTYHVVEAAAGFLQALDEIEQPPAGYAPGTMFDVGGLGMRCASDNTTNCSVTVHDDDSFTTTGTIVTVMAGGTFPMTPGEQLAAEKARADEEKARADAEKANADAAEAALQAAEAARLAAEAALAEAAAKARQADAGKALAGLASPTGDVDVTPRYAAMASVGTTPAVSFESKSLSSSSGWSVTTLSNSGFTHNDDLVVYSNLGPPTRVLLSSVDSRFADTEADTPNTMVMGTLGEADELLISSGSFPTQDGTDKPFSNNYENDDTMDGLDIVRISGTLRGASGTFQCTATDTQACTIGRRGNRYDLVAGTWTFHTTDAAMALVDDESYMYFGWWKRQQRSNEAFSFQTFSGGMHSATTGSGFDALTETATYRGPAVGQYAIYQPLGTQSDSGSFTATATLSADFDANMLSGTVSNFSNASDWTVKLNTADMAGGQVDTGGTVDWTIAGNSSSLRGGWTAEFFSEAPYVGQTPDGVAGEFTAVFDADATPGNEVGRIVGAFGARK